MQQKARDVVVIGGGLIGIETTEALVSHGCRVAIVEMLPRILGIFDWEIARLIKQHLEAKGVKVLTETKALSLEAENDQAPEVISEVRTDRGSLPADMVILAIGVRPNIKLAQQAGLNIGDQTKAIQVDDQMRTSDPDIYAAGDCVESKDRLTGKPCFVPLGSTANKQGRVVGINICGGNEIFPGVLGSTVCKVFDYCVARTGLTEEAAEAEGMVMADTLIKKIVRKKIYYEWKNT